MLWILDRFLFFQMTSLPSFVELMIQYYQESPDYYYLSAITTFL